MRMIKNVRKSNLNLENNHITLYLYFMQLKEIIENIVHENHHSIIVTLPMKVKWDDYEKELSKTVDYSHNLNFRVYNFPKGINVGDKCYIVHNNVIKGWMKIVGFSEKPFLCNTTLKTWKGKFIERSGPFHYINEKMPYNGFRGFRYFDLEEYKKQNNIN